MYIMAKQKKKRNKAYTGKDAAAARPTVTRISAVKRNRAQQWWFEKKRVAKPVAIAAGVVFAIALLVIELFSLFGGNA